MRKDRRINRSEPPVPADVADQNDELELADTQMPPVKVIRRYSVDFKIYDDGVIGFSFSGLSAATLEDIQGDVRFVADVLEDSPEDFAGEPWAILPSKAGENRKSGKVRRRTRAK